MKLERNMEEKLYTTEESLDLRIFISNTRSFSYDSIERSAHVIVSHYRLKHSNNKDIEIMLSNINKIIYMHEIIKLIKSHFNHKQMRKSSIRVQLLLIRLAPFEYINSNNSDSENEIIKQEPEYSECDRGVFLRLITLLLSEEIYFQERYSNTARMTDDCASSLILSEYLTSIMERLFEYYKCLDNDQYNVNRGLGEIFRSLEIGIDGRNNKRRLEVCYNLYDDMKKNIVKSPLIRIINNIKNVSALDKESYESKDTHYQCLCDLLNYLIRIDETNISLFGQRQQQSLLEKILVNLRQNLAEKDFFTLKNSLMKVVREEWKSIQSLRDEKKKSYDKLFKGKKPSEEPECDPKYLIDTNRFSFFGLLLQAQLHLEIAWLANLHSKHWLRRYRHDNEYSWSPKKTTLLIKFDFGKGFDVKKILDSLWNYIHIPIPLSEDVQSSRALQSDIPNVLSPLRFVYPDQSYLFELTQSFRQLMIDNENDLLSSFFIELLSQQEVNESRLSYLRRLAIVGYLIQQSNLHETNQTYLSDCVEAYDNNKGLTDEEKVQRDVYIQIMAQYYFAHFLSQQGDLTSENISTDLAINLLSQFNSLQAAGNWVYIQERELEFLRTVVVRHLFDFLYDNMSEGEPDDDFSRICEILTKFSAIHLNIKTVFHEISRFQIRESSRLQESAVSSDKTVCEYFWSAMYLPIFIMEDYDHFCDRLATIALHEYHSELKIRRMNCLFIAEEEIEKAPKSVRLTSKQFEKPLCGSMLEKDFKDVVAQRPHPYLRALVRIHKLYTIVLQKEPDDEIIVELCKYALLVTVVNHEGKYNYTVPLTESQKLKLIDNFTHIELGLLLKNHFEGFYESLCYWILNDDRSLDDLKKVSIALLQSKLHERFIDIILEKMISSTDISIFPFYRLCAIIFPEMRDSIPIIDKVITKTFDYFSQYGYLHFIEKKKLSSSIFPTLVNALLSFPEDCTKKISGYLSDCIYKLLTSSQIVGPHEPTPRALLNEFLADTILCFLKRGATLLRLQVEGSEFPSNAMLELIKQRHFDVLKCVLRYYRDRSEGGLITNLKDYVNQCPLFLAINNGADEELTLLMLKLGFSRTLVDRCMSPNCTPAESKKAAGLSFNARAMSVFLTLTNQENIRLKHENEQLQKEMGRARASDKSSTPSTSVDLMPFERVASTNADVPSEPSSPRARTPRFFRRENEESIIEQGSVESTPGQASSRFLN